MKALFLILVISLVSCKSTDEKENDKPSDTTKEILLGSDKDRNGCLASAGYTWSKLNKECVRAFTGMQLLPVDNAESDVTLCAYVLFDEDVANAELFLPNQDESVVLEATEKGKLWSDGTWQLVKQNGFQLKKDGTIVFSGDGQIGNKISGSDDTEENAPTE